MINFMFAIIYNYLIDVVPPCGSWLPGAGRGKTLPFWFSEDPLSGVCNRRACSLCSQSDGVLIKSADATVRVYCGCKVFLEKIALLWKLGVVRNPFYGLDEMHENERFLHRILADLIEGSADQ